MPLALLLLLLLAAPAAAQIDYRNLDDHRPVATEDAYPVERYAFELIAPYEFEREAGGIKLHVVAPELTYGAFANTQIGIKAPFAVVDAGTDAEWGMSGLGVFGLYNFNTESRSVPALSLRTDVSLPVGSLGGDDPRVTVKAIATRSWGRTRLHLNAARSFGPESRLAAAGSASRWAGSAALDRTFIRRSMLLIGEVAAAQAVEGAPTSINLALGTRYQWTPTLVLDAGITRRLREDVGPDISLTFGISYAFAFRGLMPTGSH